jgi:hypothetical protein
MQLTKVGWTTGKYGTSGEGSRDASGEDRHAESGATSAHAGKWRGTSLTRIRIAFLENLLEGDILAVDVVVKVNDSILRHDHGAIDD